MCMITNWENRQCQRRSQSRFKFFLAGTNCMGPLHQCGSLQVAGYPAAHSVNLFLQWMVGMAWSSVCMCHYVSSNVCVVLCWGAHSQLLTSCVPILIEEIISIKSNQTTLLHFSTGYFQYPSAARSVLSRGDSILWTTALSYPPQQLPMVSRQ